MKRITLLIALVAIAMTSIAQDIIVTRSQTRIEGKVLEISDTEVKYNKQEAPNGPSLVLPTSEIVTILFSNGEVVNFQASPATKQTEVFQEESENTQGESAPTWDNTEYVEFPIRFKTGKEIMYRTGTQLTIEQGKVYYRDVRLKEKEYKEFLSLCDGGAYQLYEEAKRCEKWGMVMLTTSLFGMGYGVYTTLSGQKKMEKKALVSICASIGIFFWSLSPMFKYESYRNQANDAFNQGCAWRAAKRQPAELSLSASPCGLGLTLTF